MTLITIRRTRCETVEALMVGQCYRCGCEFVPAAGVASSGPCVACRKGEPHLTPVMYRTVEWLPGDGSWQEGQRGRTDLEHKGIVRALNGLREIGFTEARLGRVSKYGRQLIEWRLTAAGIAYKLEQERKGRRN